MGREIQYGGQSVISFVLSCHRSKICQKDSPHQNVFKLTLSQKSFYVFRKDRQCKFIFLLSPSLDLINIISVRALEAMKVAGETLQRSRRTSPAAGSYQQPCSVCVSLNALGPVTVFLPVSYNMSWLILDATYRIKKWRTMNLCDDHHSFCSSVYSSFVRVISATW